MGSGSRAETQRHEEGGGEAVGRGQPFERLRSGRQVFLKCIRQSAELEGEKASIRPRWKGPGSCLDQRVVASLTPITLRARQFVA